MFGYVWTKLKVSSQIMIHLESQRIKSVKKQNQAFFKLIGYLYVNLQMKV